MSSVHAEGRAANQPVPLTTFKPPMGALFPGARVKFGGDGVADESVDAVTASEVSLPELCLLLGRCRSINARVVRRTKLRAKLAIVLSRIFAGSGGDFCRQQIHYRTVFVGGPNGAIAPQETRSGTFFSAKTTRAVE